MASADVLFFVRFRSNACSRIALVATTDAGFKPPERANSLAVMLAEHLDSTTWRLFAERVLEMSQQNTPPEGRPQGRPGS